MLILYYILLNMLNNYIFPAWGDPRYKAKLQDKEFKKENLNTKIIQPKNKNVEATMAGKSHRFANKLAYFSFNI